MYAQAARRATPIARYIPDPVARASPEYVLVEPVDDADGSESPVTDVPGSLLPLPWDPAPCADAADAVPVDAARRLPGVAEAPSVPTGSAVAPDDTEMVVLLSAMTSTPSVDEISL